MAANMMLSKEFFIHEGKIKSQGEGDSHSLVVQEKRQCIRHAVRTVAPTYTVRHADDT